MKEVILFIMVMLTCTCLFAQSTKITGEYTYTYGDNESLLEAKSLCYTMAIRNAIESFTVYIQSTTTIQDFRLKNDLIQAISSGYIDRLTVDEEKVEGRTIHYAISGFVNPISVKNIIDNMARKAEGAEQLGIDKNSCIKILKVTEDEEYIRVVFKYLRRWSSDVWNDATDKDAAVDCRKIFIDFYDTNGDLIDGSSRYEGTYYGSGYLQKAPLRTPGEISTIEFYKKSNAKSYRIWLYK